MERDEHIFEYVMDELENGIKNEALWIKAYAMVEGWEEKIKPKYIQYRVDEIKEEFLKNQLDFNDYTKDEMAEFLERVFDYNPEAIGIDRLLEWADENYLPDWDYEKDGYGKGLPRDKEKLLRLTKLSLSGFGISELPKEIAYLTNLTVVFFGNNQLREIPKEIGNLVNLTSLNLENNQLTELPNEIGNLTKLTVLELRDNQLKTLPKEIGNLTNLTKLYLMNSQLSELPHEFSNLVNLESFDIRENQLKRLPKKIGNLSKLTDIYLQGNQLLELPEDICNLTNLTRLQLADNEELVVNSRQEDWLNFLNNKTPRCTVYVDNYLLD